MFSYLTSLFKDPRATLMFILLAFPGRLMAIAAHEYAHARVADKCGDNTARMLGRLTLNPLKHLDPLGTVMMLVIGFGWAKPVPVNPRNYRNYRRDDLKVSLAGIAMNLALFLAGYVLLAGFAVVALRALPQVANVLTATDELFVSEYGGVKALFSGDYYYPLTSLLGSLPYLSEVLIAPALGRMAGYIFDMLSYFVQVNIVLAVFNLLPVPPLDGYHVVNDLLIRRPLFASQKTARIAMGALMVLMFTGLLGQGLGYVENAALSGLGALLNAALGALGLI